MSNQSNKYQAEIIQLKKDRDRLQKKLSEINADYRKGLSPDSEEQAIELENADVLDEIARVTAEELEKIENRLSELE